ncbi:MAG: glycosyltransferase family 4 protein [Saprospiraceae bacterium]|uniref:Glycosyltransferase family 4 protein n=1 Tax=Candidatus Opimibacter skivensis TaxID=2982028 RepID=A0A9D7XTI8_9BACT|nr:glycosyltransferase family 4 protein [Candidatus Opimibacter skivensis]
MRIAVNARHMMQDRLEGIGTVTHEIMQRIVKTHSEDRFDYYFDRPYDNRFVHGPNVMPHVFGPPARLPALIRYWNKYPVQRDVKLRKSDVFYSPDGFVPLKMKIPKVSVVHDVAFYRYPEYFVPRIRNFYKKWMHVYLEHTDHIITVSQFSKDELINAYQIPADKISVVHNGVSSGYVPFDAQKIQSFRDTHTQGKPYFFYLGAIHPRKNVITLIRAFELFKSMNRNDHQLVLAGRASWDADDVFKAVEQSKWKDNIHMPGFVNRDDTKAWMASAGALIYPSLYEGFGLPLLEGMSSGVPVISSNSSSLPEVGGDAALYFNPLDAEQLAQHMDTLVFNIKLREDLIVKGYDQIKLFSWEKAAIQTYGILSKSILRK